MVTSYYIMEMCKHSRKVEIDEYYNNLFTTSTCKSKDKCRVCLQKGKVPIFDDDSTRLPEALLIFGDIKASEDDGYPKYLCDVCHRFLKGALQFRKIAKQSEERLKQPMKDETAVKDMLNDSDHDSSNNKDEYIEPEPWNEEESTITLKDRKKVKFASKVTCHICQKIINRSYYKEHMTMHDPDHQKYVCEVCGKHFRLRCAYYNHRVRHRTDFPYKCQYCPYRGRYPELLKNHMRTHTGDYRYMCTECPARFLFKSNLNSHMLKHKEPQFNCEMCNRAFHSKLKLQRHYEADHLGIKNHVCPVCGKAFGYRNAMMKHQRHVHKREKQLFGRMPSYLVAEHKQQANG